MGYIDQDGVIGYEASSVDVPVNDKDNVDSDIVVISLYKCEEWLVEITYLITNNYISSSLQLVACSYTNKSHKLIQTYRFREC